MYKREKKSKYISCKTHHARGILQSASIHTSPHEARLRTRQRKPAVNEKMIVKSDIEAIF